MSAQTRPLSELRRLLEADAAAWQRNADLGKADVGLLDPSQLGELAGWLTVDARRGLGEAVESFIAASEAAAQRSWWPAKGSKGTALAILLVLMILATPIVLLFIVVLAASVIHRIG